MTTAVNPVLYLMNPPESVQLMGVYDTIPEELEVGFDQLGKIDRDWVWLATKGGITVGVLFASECHGVAVIWRLAVTEQATDACVLKLLRQFIRDITRRNLRGYITLVQPAQWKLQKLMEKNGARVQGEFTMLASPLPEVR